MGAQRESQERRAGDTESESNDTSDSGSTSGGGNQQVSNTGPEPRVETAWSLNCSGGNGPGAVGVCLEVQTCEPDDPDAPPPIRAYQYQRLVDPNTGEPITNWQLVVSECTSADDPPGPETLEANGDPVEAGAPTIWDLVQAEWQSIQIPSATIGINPADGRTLVNLDTIFHTTAGEQEFPVTILGQPVTIYAVPMEYTWHHGDGTSQTTTTPGAPYPSKNVTHVYESTGEAVPRVDVQYRGEFAIAGGTRQPIPGFANVTGEGEALQILEARSQLVDG